MKTDNRGVNSDSVNPDEVQRIGVSDKFQVTPMLLVWRTTVWSTYYEPETVLNALHTLVRWFFFSLLLSPNLQRRSWASDDWRDFTQITNKWWRWDLNPGLLLFKACSLPLALDSTGQYIRSPRAVCENAWWTEKLQYPKGMKKKEHGNNNAPETEREALWFQLYGQEGQYLWPQS